MFCTYRVPKPEDTDVIMKHHKAAGPTAIWGHFSARVTRHMEVPQQEF